MRNTIAFPNCVLTTRDELVLETWLERHGADDAFLADIVREKLDGARVVLTLDIDPDIATLNSRIAFTLDDAMSDIRILAHCEPNDPLVGLTLPLMTPLGLSLLGMRTGQTARMTGQNGSVLRVRLERVVYQPEASAQSRIWKTDPLPCA
ncbi:MAG: nucleoside-diphosphate kinase [Alphaproteobacteria bacterium]|nr:nucleoside-diphosphate kinase [Alphaproteobacteria bacterium]